MTSCHFRMASDMSRAILSARPETRSAPPAARAVCAALRGLARYRVGQLLARAFQPGIAQQSQSFRVGFSLRHRPQDSSSAAAQQIRYHARQLNLQLFQQRFQVVLCPHPVAAELHAAPGQGAQPPAGLPTGLHLRQQEHRVAHGAAQTRHGSLLQGEPCEDSWQWHAR